MSYLFEPAPWKEHDGGRAEAGYKGLAGDCVTRAIAIALEIPYKIVYDDLADRCRGRLDRGKPMPRSARNGVPKSVYNSYLLTRGWEWVPTMQVGQVERRHLRVGEMPAGRAICRLSGHLCASVDGVVYDTFDPSRNGTRLIYGYYRPGVPSLDESTPLARVRAIGRLTGVIRPRTV